MGYIFDDWKDLLDEFQKCVDKDLAEIQKQKAEVQQIKEGLFNSLGDGLLYRDGNRIVISAPEIVIGNVDRTGTLQGGGVGKVIIRGSEVDIEVWARQEASSAVHRSSVRWLSIPASMAGRMWYATPRKSCLRLVTSCFTVAMPLMCSLRILDWQGAVA